MWFTETHNDRVEILILLQQSPPPSPPLHCPGHIDAGITVLYKPMKSLLLNILEIFSSWWVILCAVILTFTLIASYLFYFWNSHCCYHLVAESCPTLCDPVDCSPPGSSVHGIPTGKNAGVGYHFLFLQPRDGTQFSCLLIQADSLPLRCLGSPEAVIRSLCMHHAAAAAK